MAAAAAERARRQRAGQALRSVLVDEIERMRKWKALRDAWEALEHGDPWVPSSERVRRQNKIVKEMAALHPEFTKIWYPTRPRSESVFDPAPSGRGERLRLRLPPPRRG